MRLLNIKVIIIIVVVVLILGGALVFVDNKFKFGILDKIPFTPGHNDVYKQACARYAANFLGVQKDLSARVSENDMRAAVVKKNQIAPKTRVNLADSNNKIDVRIVTMRLSINDNAAFNLTCWVNASFRDDPNLITAYDVLFFNVASINKAKDKTSLAVMEENY
jgi:hypothetical protein